eukprot:419925_1
MSQLLDISFQIKDETIKDIEAFKKNYGCQETKYKCNILNNNMKTRRRNEVLSTKRIASKYGHKEIENITMYYDGMTLEDYNKMEMLDLIHIKIFHPQNNHNQRIQKRKEKDIINEEIENNQLFKDRFDYDIDLHSLKMYCDLNEFDSEAIHNDIFPDNDSQSNIYLFFRNNNDKTKHKMDIFYLFKDDILIYCIKPFDKQANKNNLPELDFGDNIINWNIKSKYYNVKKEWMENEYDQISLDVYNSLYIKSKDIAKTNKNVSS